MIHFGACIRARNAISVPVGDTNADGFVNSADIHQTKSESGNAVGTSNFREDVNADALINSADISLVKSVPGAALPSTMAGGGSAQTPNLAPLEAHK